MITILKHGGRAQKPLWSDLNSIALTIRHNLQPHGMYNGVIYVMVCVGSASGNHFSFFKLDRLLSSITTETGYIF